MSEEVPTGMSLALTHDGSSLTTIGLNVREGMSYEEWQDMAAWIWHVYQGISWALGDALNYGERRYGDMYAQAIRITGQHYSTLATAKYVASEFTQDMRRPSLPWSYHAAVASLVHGGFVADANEILDKAEAGELKNEREVRFDAKQARQYRGLDRPREWIPDPVTQNGHVYEPIGGMKLLAEPGDGVAWGQAVSGLDREEDGLDFEAGLTSQSEMHDWLLGAMGIIGKLVNCGREDHLTLIMIRDEAVEWSRERGILGEDEDVEEGIGT